MEYCWAFLAIFSISDIFFFPFSFIYYEYFPTASTLISNTSPADNTLYRYLFFIIFFYLLLATEIIVFPSISILFDSEVVELLFSSMPVILSRKPRRANFSFTYSSSGQKGKPVCLSPVHHLVAVSALNSLIFVQVYTYGIPLPFTFVLLSPLLPLHCCQTGPTILIQWKPRKETHPLAFKYDQPCSNCTTNNRAL